MKDTRGISISQSIINKEEGVVILSLFFKHRFRFSAPISTP